MDQRADLVTDIELRDPTGYRLLPVGHGHNLLALQCEEEEFLAL
jgi:hypothetical protein